MTNRTCLIAVTFLTACEIASFTFLEPQDGGQRGDDDVPTTPDGDNGITDCTRLEPPPSRRWDLVVNLDPTGAKGLERDRSDVRRKSTSQIGEWQGALAFADLNHDGEEDVIVIDSRAAKVSVWVSSGDDKLRARSDYRTVEHPYSVAVMDVDHDGRLDIVVAGYRSDAMSVLTGEGDGSFRESSTYARCVSREVP